MTGRAAEIAKRFLFIPAVLLGVVALVVAIKTRQPPERIPVQEAATKARYIEAAAMDVVPRALGYGIVRPDKTWEAIAEVSGRIVEVHPQLKKGALLEAGTVLLRIDPADYELAIAQIEANIRSAEAQIRELETQVGNTRSLLKIEERSLALDKTNLERKQKLLTRGNTSQAAVDDEMRKVLAREQSIQGLRNSLNLIPAQRDELMARKAQYEAQLATARRDLDQTTITAPFDLRISEVTVEEAQYAAQGKVLAGGDGIAVAEVSAQVPLSNIASLIEQGKAVPFDQVSFMDVIREVIDIDAKVRLRGGTMSAEWPARFARLSDTVDPQTRALGVIVAVDSPYRQAIPGIRPPLTKNMYVEVELRGPARPGRIVVPREAVHGDRAYLLTADNRLEIRSVEVELRQTNFAVVASGIEAGDRIVVSDLVPAIDGMLLDPVRDPDITETLRAEAGGEGGIR